MTDQMQTILNNTAPGDTNPTPTSFKNILNEVTGQQSPVLENQQQSPIKSNELAEKSAAKEPTKLTANPLQSEGQTESLNTTDFVKMATAPLEGLDTEGFPVQTDSPGLSMASMALQQVTNGALPGAVVAGAVFKFPATENSPGFTASPAAFIPIPKPESSTANVTDIKYAPEDVSIVVVIAPEDGPLTLDKNGLPVGPQPFAVSVAANGEVKTGANFMASTPVTQVIKDLAGYDKDKPDPKGTKTVKTKPDPVTKMPAKFDDIMMSVSFRMGGDSNALTGVGEGVIVPAATNVTLFKAIPGKNKEELQKDYPKTASAVAGATAKVKVQPDLISDKMKDMLGEATVAAVAKYKTLGMMKAVKAVGYVADTAGAASALATGGLGTAAGQAVKQGAKEVVKYVGLETAKEQVKEQVKKIMEGDMTYIAGVAYPFKLKMDTTDGSTNGKIMLQTPNGDANFDTNDFPLDPEAITVEDVREGVNFLTDPLMKASGNPTSQDRRDGIFTREQLLDKALQDLQPKPEKLVIPEKPPLIEGTSVTIPDPKSPLFITPTGEDILNR